MLPEKQFKTNELSIGDKIKLINAISLSNKVNKVMNAIIDVKTIVKNIDCI